MKKMKLVLAVSLILSLLCGCVGSIGDVVMNEDGSGSATLSLGYTAETIAAINDMIEDEAEKTQLSELTKFTHNGVEYYGRVLSFTYEDPAELADTLNLYQESDGNGVDTGLFTFTLDEELVLQLTTNEETGVVGDANGEMELDEETVAMLEQAAVVYTFTFFDDVTQTAGRECDAIKVDGKTLTIDYTALSKELDGKGEEFAFAVKHHKIPTAKSASFPDVKQGDWFYDNVISMANLGLINGRVSGLFCPSDTMTCAEFTTIAVRAFAGEAAENLLVGKESAWWDKYYSAAQELEILDAQLFPQEGMDGAMTRAEMAQMAYAIIVKSYADDALDTDAAIETIPDWASVREEYGEAVAYCYAAGILQGMDAEGTFAPNASMTRAQASTVMARVLNWILE